MRSGRAARPRGPDEQATPAPRPERGRRTPAVIAAVFGSAGPLVVYFLVRPHVGGDAAALAIAAAGPVAVAVAVSVLRRRTVTLSLLIAAGFGIALAVTVFSGGSSLPLKLFRAATAGVAGATCLLSVALRRPLALLLLRTAGGDPARGQAAERISAAPETRRALTVITAVVGAGFIAEAVVTTVLALSVSTGTFLIASRAAKWTILGIDAAVIVGYLRRRGARPVAAKLWEAKNWFGPKRLGIGWGRPRTWQARVLVLAAAVLVVCAKLLLRH